MNAIATRFQRGIDHDDGGGIHTRYNDRWDSHKSRYKD